MHKKLVPKIYLVGGAVRDALLGQTVLEKDWVVVGATPEEMKRRGFKQVGKNFPVFINRTTNEEYALARTERKISPGYHGFQFDTSPTISIKEDLKRRDLTINAIAQEKNGTLIDPWGGQSDIATRVLRHISDAFAEDPLRILRVARLAARFHELGFTIAPETLSLMKQMVAKGEANYLVAERIWQETVKAFASNHPSVYLNTLMQVGALACISPELNELLCCPAMLSDTDPKLSRDAPLRETQTSHTAIPPDTDPKPASMNVRLYTALDQAPKGLAEILLAILSFHAHRNGLSIGTLNARWKLPSRCSWMVNAAEQFDDKLEAIADLSGDALLDFLERADAFRQQERFENLLTAYRSSVESTTQIERNLDYVMRVLDALQTIEWDSKLNNLSGKHAKRQVRELRLRTISSISL